MQLTNIFVSALLATAVSAKGHNGTDKAQSVKSQCSQMAKLTAETKLAANDTKLAQHFDNNQTMIDAFKTKAADAQTKLTTMEANTTLTAECAVIQAHDEAVSACGAMSSIEKMVSLAANDTKLTTKFDGNTTKIDAFKAKVADAEAKLTTMQANSTLTSFCSVQATISQCKEMSQLQKEVAMASNETALATKFKGNDTKIADFKAKAAKTQTKLDALMGNSTLMDTCSTLTKAGTTGASTSTNNAKSPAARVEIAGGVLSVAAFVVTLGMLAL